MHTLNASSEGVVSCLGSTTVHTGVCSWDQIGCMSLTVTSNICICVYTSHKIQRCGNVQIQTDDSHLVKPSIPMMTDLETKDNTKCQTNNIRFNQ